MFSRAAAGIVGSRLVGNGKVIVVAVVVRGLTYIPESMSWSWEMWRWTRSR